MARQSTQHKLDRVRSPRVHITYDVEVGGAIELKELPFVMGVLGDFTGQPVEAMAKLKDRKFVEVNPDNFDSVLAGMKPHLAFSVDNKLSDDANAGQLKVASSRLPSGAQSQSLTGSRPSKICGCSRNWKHSCSLTCASGEFGAPCPGACLPAVQRIGGQSCAPGPARSTQGLRRLRLE